MTVPGADEFRLMVTIADGILTSYTLISGETPPFATTTCVSFTFFSFINSTSQLLTLYLNIIYFELVL